MNHNTLRNFIIPTILLFGFMPYEIVNAAQNLKLPYEKGEEFVVVQGYDTLPTHIRKDEKAIDFSQNGCEAYAKAALAASSGKVMLAEENGYNGGYGTQILIDDGKSVVSRYAHLLPGTIPVENGAVIMQGQFLGLIGNTGLVAGAACRTHPGTHIHFAMYDRRSDGTSSAHLPEPISHYTDITVGHWYLSDNEMNDGGVAAEDLSAPVEKQVMEEPPSDTGNEISSSSFVIDQPTEVVTPSSSPPPTFIGGVSFTPPVPTYDSGGNASDEPAVSSTVIASTTETSLRTFALTSSFRSSTLAIDVAWQPVEVASGSSNDITYALFDFSSGDIASGTPIGTTTSTTFSYPVPDGDFGYTRILEVQANDASGSLFAIASATISLPDWLSIFQPLDNENSAASWYSDNWYDLGTGFSGTILALTFEGYVDSVDHRTSYLWLDEYLDSNYTSLSQTFTISNDAPFSNEQRRVAIGGLDIPLQPNQYYRLRTYQGRQNSSIILAGTTATGTAMRNEFHYGIGRIEQTYSFYPYMKAIMIPNDLPLTPPDPPA